MCTPEELKYEGEKVAPLNSPMGIQPRTSEWRCTCTCIPPVPHCQNTSLIHINSKSVESAILSHSVLQLWIYGMEEHLGLHSHAKSMYVWVNRTRKTFLWRRLPASPRAEFELCHFQPTTEIWYHYLGSGAACCGHIAMAIQMVVLIIRTLRPYKDTIWVVSTAVRPVIRA